MKKNEKQSTIHSLLEIKKQEMEDFITRKKLKEKDNESKIVGLKILIAELEEKLESKQQEIIGLSEIMVSYILNFRILIYHNHFIFFDRLSELDMMQKF